jgi:hypothetical protein
MIGRGAGRRGDGETGRRGAAEIYPPCPSGTPVLTFFYSGVPQNKNVAPRRGFSDSNLQLKYREERMPL